MLVLNVTLKNAEEIDEFKKVLQRYDREVSTVIGGHVIARPMITSSPYITPLDDIAIHYNGESINEFMQMIRELDQYIVDKQDDYTKSAIDKVHEIMRKEKEESSEQEENHEVNT